VHFGGLKARLLSAVILIVILFAMYWVAGILGLELLATICVSRVSWEYSRLFFKESWLKYFFTTLSFELFILLSLLEIEVLPLVHNRLGLPRIIFSS
jgi:CDP-diglyceride synthetase